MKFEELLNYDEIDKIAETEKIYYSHSYGIDKISSKRFFFNRNKEINFIINKLKNGTYSFSPYKIKLILKGPEKEPRITCIPTIRDKLVIAILKKYLYDVYEDVSINSSANEIIRKIIKIKKSNVYDTFIKIDIKSFFNNVDHDNLKEILKAKIDDDNVLNLISDILENPQKYSDNDKKTKNLCGIPQGLSVSTILANIYLKDLDSKYSKKDLNYEYFRYVDDIIIFCKSEDKDRIYSRVKRAFITRYELNFNKEKEQSGNINEMFEYLGYKFLENKISVRDSSRIKFEQSLENIFKNFSRQNKKDERNIKKFIWLLNSKITGIKVDNKRYGWLYYYSCINDFELLVHLDLLIKKFIERFKLSEIIDTKLIKSFQETYISMKQKDNSYLLDLNNIKLDEEIEFLKIVCGIKVNEDGINGDEIDRKFKYNFFRHLKNLEKDLDSISG